METNEITLTGNAVADDFTITSTLALNALEVLLPHETHEQMLPLIQTELLKSGKISSADLNAETNEITLTGNAAADDFVITSTISLNAVEVLPVWETHTYILELIGNELLKSGKITSEDYDSENNKITLTGNNDGDDFTINSTISLNALEVLPVWETHEQMLPLIQAELLKSGKISTAVLENNEITLTGNAAADDFVITSTISLNAVEVLPVWETHEQMLPLIQAELLKSDKITVADLNAETNEIILTGNAAADDFTITSTISLNALEVLPRWETQEQILTLIKDELATATDQISNANVNIETYEIIVTGNEGGDDFDITSNFALNDIITILPSQSILQVGNNIPISHIKKLTLNETIPLVSGLHTVSIGGSQVGNNIPIPHVKKLTLEDYSSITSGVYTVSVDGSQIGDSITIDNETDEAILTEEEILTLMKTELEKSTKIVSGVVANNEITLTGNATADDFVITSTISLNALEVLSPVETHQQMLPLIQTELVKSGKINTAVLENNEITLTGNEGGDDFDITSNFALNDIITILPSQSILQGESVRYTEEEILALMRYEIRKSSKIAPIIQPYDLSSSTSTLSSGHGNILSSSENGAFSAAKAFDGNISDSNSRWISAPESQTNYTTTLDDDDNTVLTGNWLQIDIGQNVIVKNFKIRHALATYHRYKEADVLTSLTGEDGTWKSIYSIRTTSDPGIVYETYNVEEANYIEGRYYRMVIMESWHDEQVGVIEWDLLGVLSTEHLVPSRSLVDNNELTLTGNDAGDDFTISSTLVLNNGYLKTNTDALLGSISNNTGSVVATAGTFTDIAVSGGSGNDAIATVVTSETDVTSVTITTAGSGYAIDDVLTISGSDIGRGDDGVDLEFTLIEDDLNALEVLPRHETEEEILTLIQTELLKSGKVNTAVLENNEITLTGNAAGDDFTITSTMDLNDIEILLPHETEEEILTLMKTELEKSDKISSGVIASNELTLTGNAVADDFTLTTTIDINGIEVLPPILPSEEGILTLMKDEFVKSPLIDISETITFVTYNELTLTGNDAGDDFIITSNFALNDIEILLPNEDNEEILTLMKNELVKSYKINNGSSTIFFDESTTQIDLSTPSSELISFHGNILSSSETDLYDASKAFDPASNAGWISDSETQANYTTTLDNDTVLTGNWVQIDLGTKAKVKNFDIQTHGYAQYPKLAEVLTSHTGVDGTWKSIYSINNPNPDLDNTWRQNNQFYASNSTEHVYTSSGFGWSAKFTGSRDLSLSPFVDHGSSQVKFIVNNPGSYITVRWKNHSGYEALGLKYTTGSDYGWTSSVNVYNAWKEIDVQHGHWFGWESDPVTSTGGIAYEVYIIPGYAAHVQQIKNYAIANANQIYSRYHRMVIMESWDTNNAQVGLSEWKLNGIKRFPRLLLTGNAAGDDFEITTAIDINITETPPVYPSEEELLILMKTELLKSDKISAIQLDPLVMESSTNPYRTYDIDISSQNSLLQNHLTIDDFRAKITQSNNYSSNYQGYEAFDNSNSTSNEWISVSYTQDDHTTTLDDNTVLTGNWIQIDIGQEVAVKRLKIYGGSRDYSRHKRAEFLTSLTGVDGTWKSIYSIRNETHDYGPHKTMTYEIENSNQIVGIYYRMVIMESWDTTYSGGYPQHVSITELTLYGSPSIPFANTTVERSLRAEDYTGMIIIGNTNPDDYTITSNLSNNIEDNLSPIETDVERLTLLKTELEKETNNKINSIKITTGVKPSAARGKNTDGSDKAQAINLVNHGGLLDPIVFTFYGGIYPHTLSWSVLQNGNSIISGGPYWIGYRRKWLPTVTQALPAGDYVFQCRDAWGYGWNGATYTISKSNGDILATGTLANGDVGNFPFTVPGPTTFSSRYNSDYSGHDAWNSSSYHWKSLANTQKNYQTETSDGTIIQGNWTQIELGETAIVTKFRIYTPDIDYCHIRRAEVMTSLTGEDNTWTVIYSIFHETRVGTTSDLTYDIEEEDQIVGRFYRIVIVESHDTTYSIESYGGSEYVGLSELNLFGFPVLRGSYESVTTFTFDDIMYNYLELKGNNQGDDFVITSDIDILNDMEVVPPNETFGNILESIKTELLTSNKISSGVVANNELTLTGNDDSDDFTITSDFALNALEVLPPVEREDEILELMKTELQKSDKIKSIVIGSRIYHDAGDYGCDFVLTGNDQADDFTITSTLDIDILFLQEKKITLTNYANITSGNYTVSVDGLQVGNVITIDTDIPTMEEMLTLMKTELEKSDKITLGVVVNNELIFKEKYNCSITSTLDIDIDTKIIQSRYTDNSILQLMQTEFEKSNKVSTATVNLNNNEENLVTEFLIYSDYMGGARIFNAKGAKPFIITVGGNVRNYIDVAGHNIIDLSSPISPLKNDYKFNTGTHIYTASSDYNGLASNLFDGNYNTYWQNSYGKGFNTNRTMTVMDDNPWVQIDIAREAILTSFNIYYGNDNYGLKSATISAANNADGPWTPIYTITDRADVRNVTESYYIEQDNQMSARYYRLDNMTSLNDVDQNYKRIRQWTLFGTLSEKHTMEEQQDPSPNINNTSIYFNGSTDYLRMDEAFDWHDDVNKDFTVECWWKWENNNGLLNTDVDALLGSISNETGSIAATAGTYTDITVSGGSGNGAIASVVTSETDVTSVTITSAGSGYAIDDVLTISSSDIGRGDDGADLEFTLIVDHLNNNGYMWVFNEASSGDNQFIMRPDYLSLDNTNQGDVSTHGINGIYYGVNDGLWHHTAVVYDTQKGTGTLTWYVDGKVNYQLIDHVMFTIPLKDCVCLLGNEADSANGGGLQSAHAYKGHIDFFMVSKIAKYKGSCEAEEWSNYLADGITPWLKDKHYYYNNINLNVKGNSLTDFTISSTIDNNIEDLTYTQKDRLSFIKTELEKEASNKINISFNTENIDEETEFLLVSELLDSNYDINSRIFIDKTDKHLINNPRNNSLSDTDPYITHSIQESHPYSVYNYSIKFPPSVVNGLECNSSLSFLNDYTTPFTIEGWMFSSSLSDDDFIFSISSTIDEPSEIALTTGSKIHVNRSEEDLSGNEFVKNTWNHWAVVGEPNSNAGIHYDIKVYKNGSYQGSWPYDKNVLLSNCCFIIGSRNMSWPYYSLLENGFEGYMDNIRISRTSRYTGTNDLPNWNSYLYNYDNLIVNNIPTTDSLNDFTFISPITSETNLSDFKYVNYYYKQKSDILTLIKNELEKSDKISSGVVANNELTLLGNDNIDDFTVTSTMGNQFIDINFDYHTVITKDDMLTLIKTELEKSTKINRVTKGFGGILDTVTGDKTVDIYDLSTHTTSDTHLSSILHKHLTHAEFFNKITYSSRYDSNYSGHEAFDNSNSNSNEWQSGSWQQDNHTTTLEDETILKGNWLQIDIGQNVIVYEFDLQNGTRDSARIREAEVLTSDTGEDGTWKSIYSVRNREYPADYDKQTYNIEEANIIVGRYYRIVVMHSYDDTINTLDEEQYVSVTEWTLKGIRGIEHTGYTEQSSLRITGNSTEGRDFVVESTFPLNDIENVKDTTSTERDVILSSIKSALESSDKINTVVLDDETTKFTITGNKHFTSGTNNILLDDFTIASTFNHSITDIYDSNLVLEEKMRTELQKNYYITSSYTDLSSTISPLHTDHGEITYSSRDSSSYSGHEAFDNSNSTSNEWISYSYTQDDYSTTLDDQTILKGNWVQIDIGQEVAAKLLKIYSGSRDYSRHKRAEFLMSPTGVDGTWKSIYSIRNYTDPGSNSTMNYEIENSNQIIGRYYRLVIMESWDLDRTYPTYPEGGDDVLVTTDIVSVTEMTLYGLTKDDFESGIPIVIHKPINQDVISLRTNIDLKIIETIDDSLSISSLLKSYLSIAINTSNTTFNADNTNNKSKPIILSSNDETDDEYITSLNFTQNEPNKLMNIHIKSRYLTQSQINVILDNIVTEFGNINNISNIEYDIDNKNIDMTNRINIGTITIKAKENVPKIEFLNKKIATVKDSLLDSIKTELEKSSSIESVGKVSPLNLLQIKGKVGENIDISILSSLNPELFAPGTNGVPPSYDLSSTSSTVSRSYSASSYHNDSYAIDHAFNNNASEFWGNNSTSFDVDTTLSNGTSIKGVWIQVDMGENVIVTGLQLKPYDNLVMLETPWRSISFSGSTATFVFMGYTFTLSRYIAYSWMWPDSSSNVETKITSSSRNDAAKTVYVRAQWGNYWYTGSYYTYPHASRRPYSSSSFYYSWFFPEVARHMTEIAGQTYTASNLALGSNNYPIWPNGRPTWGLYYSNTGIDGSWVELYKAVNLYSGSVFTHDLVASSFVVGKYYRLIAENTVLTDNHSDIRILYTYQLYGIKESDTPTINSLSIIRSDDVDQDNEIYTGSNNNVNFLNTIVSTLSSEKIIKDVTVNSSGENHTFTIKHDNSYDSELYSMESTANSNISIDIIDGKISYITPTYQELGELNYSDFVVNNVKVDITVGDLTLAVDDTDNTYGVWLDGQQIGNDIIFNNATQSVNDKKDYRFYTPKDINRTYKIRPLETTTVVEPSTKARPLTLSGGTLLTIDPAALPNGDYQLILKIGDAEHKTSRINFTSNDIVSSFPWDETVSVGVYNIVIGDKMINIPVPSTKSEVISLLQEEEPLYIRVDGNNLYSQSYKIYINNQQVGADFSVSSSSSKTSILNAVKTELEKSNQIFNVSINNDEMSVNGVNNAIISSNASFLHFSKHKLSSYTCSQDGGQIKIIHSNSLNISSNTLTITQTVDNGTNHQDFVINSFMRDIKDELEEISIISSVVYNETSNIYQSTINTTGGTPELKIRVYENGLPENQYIEYATSISKIEETLGDQIGRDITVNTYDTIIGNSSMNILPFNIVNNSENITEKIIIESSNLINNTYYPLRDHDGSYKLIIDGEPNLINTSRINSVPKYITIDKSQLKNGTYKLVDTNGNQMGNDIVIDGYTEDNGLQYKGFTNTELYIDESEMVSNGNYKLYVGEAEIEATLSDIILQKTIKINADTVVPGIHTFNGANGEDTGINIGIPQNGKIEVGITEDQRVPGIYPININNEAIGNIEITDDKKISAPVIPVNNVEIDIGSAVGSLQKLIFSERFKLNTNNITNFRNGRYNLFIDTDDGNGDVFVDFLKIKSERTIGFGELFPQEVCIQ